tara:strand:- start:1198 stop:2940 length:1743 start_codon:yes stop_codon:yes gene_type:complete
MISIKSIKNLILDIYDLFGRKHLSSFFYLLILLIISSVFEIMGISLIPIFISLLIDPILVFEKLSSLFEFIDFKKFETLDKTHLILYFSIFVVIFFILKNLFLVFVLYLQGSFHRTLKKFLSYKIYSKYLSADYSFFLSRNSSITTRTIVNDVGNSSIYMLNIINLLRESLVLIAVVTLLLTINFTIALGLFAFFSTFTFIFFSFTQKQLYRRSKKLQSLSSHLLKIITETLGSIKQIILSNVGDSQLRDFKEYITENENLVIKNYFVQLLPRFFMEILVVSSLVSIVFVFVLLGKEMLEVIPYLTLISISAIRLLPAFSSLNNALVALRTTLPSLNHCIKENKLLKIKTKNKNKKQIKFDQRIKLKNISFSYPDTTKKILDKFSIKIRKGDKIGIIGESGTGKTTLLNIILGLIRPTSGDFLVDNKVLNFNKHFWGDTVGFVPQEIFLLDNTIKKNITFGLADDKIDKKLMEKVCKTAQIYKHVQSLPKKFNTIVGEHGHNLSVGQKQRLGIARILYRKPKLIILDEATSSLDYKNEQKFIDDIFNIDSNITIIFVSHKMSALRNCKKIYNLSKQKFMK